MDYYLVKPKYNQNARGTLIARLHNDMEVLVGEEPISDLGLSIDGDRNVVSSKDCIVQQISCIKKEEYMRGYGDWKDLQTLTDNSRGPLPSLSGKVFPNGLF